MGAIRTTVIKIKRKKKKKSKSYLLNDGPDSNKKFKSKFKNKTVSSYVVRALLGWVDRSLLMKTPNLVQATSKYQWVQSVLK